jgi:hypothetical protein
MGTMLKTELKKLYQAGITDSNLTNDHQAEAFANAIIKSLKITIPPGKVVVQVVGGSGIMNTEAIICNVDSF